MKRSIAKNAIEDIEWKTQKKNQLIQKNRRIRKAKVQEKQKSKKAETNRKKKESKIVGIDPTTAIIILNVNGSKFPLKSGDCQTG